MADVPELTLPMSKSIKNEEIFPSSLLDCKLRDRADTKGVIKHSQYSSVVFLPPLGSGKKGEEQILLLGQLLEAFALNLTRAKYGMKCVTNERHKSIHAGNLRRSGIHSLHINNSFCGWRLCL